LSASNNCVSPTIMILHACYSTEEVAKLPRNIASTSYFLKKLSNPAFMDVLTAYIYEAFICPGFDPQPKSI